MFVNSIEKYYKHPSSYVDRGAIVGEGTKIGHFSHVHSDAVIGENCTLGEHVTIAKDVRIGNDVCIQNNVSVEEGVEMEDKVFCGTSCVFTQEEPPRANTSNQVVNTKTLIKEGASLGANSTIICGHTIGRYSLIWPGSFVTDDVKDYALMAIYYSDFQDKLLKCNTIFFHLTESAR